MNNETLFSGNACFLVKYEDNKYSKINFINFLEDEGFRKTIDKFNASKSKHLFINVNSMIYGSGPSKPYKLTDTIVGEDPPNAFNVDEFKTIWDVLKKYRINKETVEYIDNTMMACGNSTFLVKEDTKESRTKFFDYLKIHKFEPLDDFHHDWSWILINVYAMLFSTSPHVISSNVGNIPGDALSIEEFKSIWDIIIKHKDNKWNIENYIDDCKEAYKKEKYHKVLETTDKILKLDKSNELAFEYKIISLFNFKKYGEALTYLEEAIKNNPDNYKFYNIKAFICTDLYRIDEAINCYNESFIHGGFDHENEKLLEYRAKCYLKKAREDHYIRNDDAEALKSLNIYLKKYPDDKFALKFKQELTQDYAPFKYADKLFYFETKANELYEYACLEESYECYKKDVLKASMDFKKNVPNIEYLGYDFVNRCSVTELENFKWYEEVLLKNLQDFSGNYSEFFDNIYEISHSTIDACLDKAKLYSKIYDDDLTLNYVKKLVQICPDNKDVKEFYDRILNIKNVYNVVNTCNEFKDYNSLEEYIEDLILCIVAYFSYYDEKTARREVEKSRNYVEKAYEKQWAAGELAWDFAILP